MDNDHHNIPHGPSLPERIGPRQDPRSFFWCFWCVGGSSSLLFLFTPFFIVIFLLLNGVPRIGTYPISPYLQLLGVVVRTKKYDRVRHKALNAIMAAFSIDAFVFSVIFSCFRAFPILWNDIECRYWSYVASFTLDYIHSRRILHGQGGIFPWAEPLA